MENELYVVWDCSGKHIITKKATWEQVIELELSLGCITYQKLNDYKEEVE